MRKKPLATKDIGERVRRARIAKGYTQDYLSSICEVDRKQISLFETGKAGISMTTFYNLCKLLDTSADYILYGTSNRSTPIEKLLENLSSHQKDTAHEIIKLYAEEINLSKPK